MSISARRFCKYVKSESETIAGRNACRETPNCLCSRRSVSRLICGFSASFYVQNSPGNPSFSPHFTKLTSPSSHLFRKCFVSDHCRYKRCKQKRSCVKTKGSRTAHRNFRVVKAAVIYFNTREDQCFIKVFLCACPLFTPPQ